MTSATRRSGNPGPPASAARPGWSDADGPGSADPATEREEHQPPRTWLATSAIALAIVGALAAACSGGRHVQRPDGIDVSDYPSEIQDAYDVFAFRCSRCHSLARPLNAQVTDVRHWDDYVARMRRQPGSGINRHNARQILKFLYYYTRAHTGQENGS